LNVGDTFLDPGRGVEWHLYVVVAKTVGGEVLAFNLTSHSPGCDESCVIEPGEHPYVTRRSVIAYRMTQTFPELELDDSLRNGTRRAHERASDALVRKIQRGGLASDKTKNGYKEILIAAGVRRPGLSVVAVPRQRQ
jgi:hypothetical protein